MHRCFCEKTAVKWWYVELFPQACYPYNKQIFFFLDWPVFNEVDNFVHKDYDELDNQRVSVFPTENEIAVP